MREMKQSEISYIGLIPLNWNVQRAKFLVSEPISTGAGEEAKDYTKNSIRYIRISDFDKNGNIMEDKAAYIPYEKGEKYKINSGDILAATAGATVGKTLLFKGLSEEACYAGYLAKIAINKDLMDERFVYYQTKCSLMDGFRELYVKKNTIENISAGAYAKMPVVVAPKKETIKIDDYLDSKCSSIDSAISKITEEIEKLEEYKKAVITEVVTKGLNPDVENKKTGNKLIDAIPASANITRLKYYVSLTDGTHDTPDYVFPGEDTFPLVTSKCIIEGELNLDLANHISKEDYDEINKRSKVHKYDVIMPMIGTVGNPAIIQDNGDFAIKNVALFKTNGDYYKAKYLVYLLNSNLIKTQLDLQQRGGVQNFVSQKVINNLMIIIHKNVKEIVNYLDKKTTTLQKIINKKKEQREKLEEYKNSLIYECVTGKKDIPVTE